MGDSDILVKGGRQWFSWAVLAGVAVMAVSAAGIYFSVTSGQHEIAARLETNEAAVVKATDKLTQVADDMRAMRYDVNASLADRWTGTDMRFLWSEIGRFWSDFSRLNPTIQVPPWPPASRVTAGDGTGR